MNRYFFTDSTVLLGRSLRHITRSLDTIMTTVITPVGSVTVPVDVVPMADDVVWLPANSPGSAVRADLGAGHGSRVILRRAE